MVNAYITNEGSKTVSVIDTSANTVSTTIAVGAYPWGVAVTPDGSKVYIANEGSDSVSVIDTGTNTVSTTISIATGAAPEGVVISPDGSKAYVANTSNSTISVIDTGTDTISTTISSVINPTSLAITPDGSKLYVVSRYIDSMAYIVSVFDTGTNTVITTITVGTTPEAIAITPDGSKAYVPNSTDGTVSVIDTSTNTVNSTITVGTNPQWAAASPDGSTVYVTNGTSNNISVIDTGIDTVITTIAVGNQPVGVAFTPDGTVAYVTSYDNGKVYPITVATNSVGSAITVGANPNASGIFIQPASQFTGVDMPILQGRLTLSSTLPVMTADATAQTILYYLPYQGAAVPVYNGSLFINYTLGSSGISLALDSNSAHTGYQQSGKLFDIFAFLNSGVLTLGTGPAWTNNTTRSAAITQISGIWVNNVSITLKYDTSSSTASVSANQATYLGTMYATANGQTGIALAPAAATGGTNNYIGLWNAYNRIRVQAECRDSTTTWTYSTNAWRNANNSASNRINFLDGLGQSFIETAYNCQLFTSSAAVSGGIGIGVNASSPLSDEATVNFSSAQSAIVRSRLYPLLGLNYVQAVENNQTGSGTVTFQCYGVYQALTLTFDM